jgi:hypothetical protein
MSRVIKTYKQGLQEKFGKAEQDCLGPPGQAETSLKNEDLRSNKTTWKTFINALFPVQQNA